MMARMWSREFGVSELLHDVYYRLAGDWRVYLLRRLLQGSLGPGARFACKEITVLRWQ